MITQEEIKNIIAKTKVCLSEEYSLTVATEEIEKDQTMIEDVMRETGLCGAAHQVYHTIEQSNSCGVAINTVTMKAFLLGYKCRKAMEEEKELARLISAADSLDVS